MLPQFWHVVFVGFVWECWRAHDRQQNIPRPRFNSDVYTKCNAEQFSQM